MPRRTLIIMAAVTALAAVPASAMRKHDRSGTPGACAIRATPTADHGAHGRQTDPRGRGGKFSHRAAQGGIDAEFQVMDLAAMNMASDKGDTHHIVVSLREIDGGAPVTGAVGAIKVIAPDKSEQERLLKNYNGILAANFRFKGPGKYGVICMLRTQQGQQVFTFGYEPLP